MITLCLLVQTMVVEVGMSVTGPKGAIGLLGRDNALEIVRMIFWVGLRVNLINYKDN